MPIREYECDVCGHKFERIQKFSDPPLETCPKCGGQVRKLIAAPAFQFKGSGWYITDYAKKDSAPEGKSEGSSKTEDASGKSEGPTQGKDAAPAKTDTASTTSDANSAPSTPTPKTSGKDR